MIRWFLRLFGKQEHSFVPLGRKGIIGHHGERIWVAIYQCRNCDILLCSLLDETGEQPVNTRYKLCELK